MAERPTPADREVDLRALVAFVVGLVVLVVLSLGVSDALVGWLGARAEAAAPPAPPLPGARARWLPPAPRLSAAPPEELAAVREEARSVLGSYGWTDPEAGLVRVPVERALELVLARGLPPAEPREPSPTDDGDGR